MPEELDMKRLVRGFVVASCMAATGAAVYAQTQSTRTFVSGTGDDVFPCTRTAPCRTFAGALAKTVRGGEISVMDPGGFGAVTIDRSVTISGDGTLASIVFPAVTAITVNITDPTDTAKKVVLRNLSMNGASSNSLNGQPTGLTAIRLVAGREVQIDKVDIVGCTQIGVDVDMSGGAPGSVYIHDSTIANCPVGIRARAGSGFAAVVLDNVRIEGTDNGVELQDNGRLVARESTFAGTGLNQNGVLLGAATAQASLERCTFAFNNASGVHAGAAGAIARVASSAFLGNSNGITNVAGAQTLSDDRNVFSGNAVAGTFTGTLAVK
jgi:hypothetical protein